MRSNTRLIDKKISGQCKAYQIITDAHSYDEAVERCDNLSADLLGPTLDDVDYEKFVLKHFAHPPTFLVTFYKSNKFAFKTVVALFSITLKMSTYTTGI